MNVLDRSNVGGSFWMRWVARGILVLWGAFWLWFNIASGIGEFAKEGPGALVWHLVLAVLLAVAVLVAWRWDAPGGLLLLALAGLALGFFRPRLDVVALLILPAALAGILLLLAWSRPGAKPVAGGPS